MSLSIHIIFLWRLDFQDKIHVSIWLGLLKHLKLQIWGWIILYLLRFYLNVFSPLFWPICSSEEFWFAWFILISYTIQPSVTENMKRLVCFSLIKSITILYTLFQMATILVFFCFLANKPLLPHSWTQNSNEYFLLTRQQGLLCK